MKVCLGRSATNIDEDLGYRMLRVCNSDVNLTPHYHEYYEFFLTCSDGIIHLINVKQAELPCRSLVFIRPNDIHCYKRTGKELSFLNFALSADIMEPRS